MKKDAYFFPHYCNARHDRKLKRVIKELGVEGYGIYFMLLEVLREQTDFRFPLNDLDLLADEFNTSEQKIRTVICNYNLFDLDESENFFSIKLIFYLQPYIEKVERARFAANQRWSKVRELNPPNMDANALHEHSQCNTDAMQGDIGEVGDIGDKGEDLNPLSTVARIDHVGLVQAYHLLCPSLPRVEKITEGRKKAIRTAMKNHGLDGIEMAFSKAESSDFLSGRDGKWSSCGFDWILKPANIVKIIEGNYDNKGYHPKSRYEESVLALHNWTPPEERS